MVTEGGAWPQVTEGGAIPFRWRTTYREFQDNVTGAVLGACVHEENRFYAHADKVSQHLVLSSLGFQ